MGDRRGSAHSARLAVSKEARRIRCCSRFGQEQRFTTRFSVCTNRPPPDRPEMARASWLLRLDPGRAGGSVPEAIRWLVRVDVGTPERPRAVEGTHPHLVQVAISRDAVLQQRPHITLIVMLREHLDTGARPFALDHMSSVDGLPRPVRAAGDPRQAYRNPGNNGGGPRCLDAPPTAPAQVLRRTPPRGETIVGVRNPPNATPRPSC